jgi:hypothetical protein
MIMKTKLCFVLILIASLTVFPASVTSAQGSDVEPNNTCATAQNLGPAVFPLSVYGELAQKQLPSGNDVDFFRFTGTPNTVLQVDLQGEYAGRGTLHDPYLGFFDSNCNPIAQNDDSGGNLSSRLFISIPQDGIVVLGATQCCDNNFEYGGLGTYLLSTNEVPPPPNDNFASATSVPSLPFDHTVDTFAATMEAGEPASSCAWNGPVNTVWYTFTPVETGKYSASLPFTSFIPALAVYTGHSLADLSEVGCTNYWQSLIFHAEAGTTYYIQLGSLFSESQRGGTAQFHLDAAPPPMAGMCYYPSDPSSLEWIQFYDCSYDPAGANFQSFTWNFGDGIASTDYAPSHMFAKDGDYTVQHGVTTSDGRSASTSQGIQVRTHDVSIAKLLAPKTAGVGQKKTITLSIKNNRYTERVRIDLYKSNATGGYDFVNTLTKSVPPQKGNRTTQFSFNYTFTQQDARMGKVTFRAIVTIENARDAFPYDNEIISMPPTIIRSGVSYP